MASNEFPKAARVTRGDDFTEIIRGGSYAADDVIVVNLRWAKAASNTESSELPLAKMGVTIPKKTGNAVVRNRWKRWIREAFRQQRSRLPRGLEIIVRPKRDAVGSYAAVARTMEKTVWRAVKKLPPRTSVSDVTTPNRETAP
jgi:ribonuclease P protein component